MPKIPIAALALFSLAVVSCAEPLASPTAPREAAVRSRTAARSQLNEAGSTAGLMSTTPTSVCALTATSQMYCWGTNDRFQLGIPGSAQRPLPVLSGIQGLQQLSTGTAQHMCGITATGVAQCWGRGGFGQLGGGVAGSGGPNGLTTVVGGISWSSITRGRLATCGVSTSGVGYCWGANQQGEIGNASLAMTAGASPFYTTPQLADGGLAFKTITKGLNHGCGLTGDGVVYCWGDNNSGQLGLGSASGPVRSPQPIASTERFVQISAGGKYTCGVTVHARIFCWGENLNGQLGDGTVTRQPTPTQVASGQNFSYVVATSANVSAPVLFGRGHTCALTTDGAAYCWGLNDKGQLGDGSTTDQLTPAPVAGNLTFTSIATGEQFTCGMRGRAVWCWGLNSSGQLGNGTLANSSLPLRVSAPFDQGAQAISFGALSNKIVGDAAFGVSASATSNLTVVFDSDTPGVCTVSGATVTLVQAGSCVIRASQAGDLSWLPATDVTQSFMVGYDVPALLPPGDKAFNAGSTVPVKFALTSADGQPIADALAASLGCTVNVSFNGGSPVCADYAPGSGQFHANIKTSKSLTAGATYLLSITVTVGTDTVTNATFALVAK